MNIKTIAATALLASALTVASAQDLSSTIAPVPGGPGVWSTPIDAVHLQAGSFTDTFELGSFAQAVVADGNLSTINFGLAFNVDFAWARLSNGVTTVHYAFLPEDGFGFEDGEMAPSLFAAGLPLTLTVQGIAAPGQLAGSLASASYSGNVNFAATPVPEPTAAALLLAGLAAVGWLTRRRLG